jgi:hypothetical protein
VRGFRTPTLPHLQDIARETGADVHWLAFGDGGEQENGTNVNGEIVAKPKLVRQKADARRAVMRLPAGAQVNFKNLPDGTIEVTIEF